MNKIVNNINSIKYLRKDIKPKLTKYFDETTSLYLERKIEKQASMMKIINLLRQGKRDEAKSLIKKYRKYTPVKGIKAKGAAFNPKNRTKNNFHIQVNVKVNMYYKKTKTSYIENITESKIIDAYTLEQAKSKYSKKIRQLYNFEDSQKIATIKDINFISVLSVDEPAINKSLSVMRMKAASVLNTDYEYVKEFKGYLDTDKNMCVVNNICGFFKDQFKISEELFIKMCHEYYNKIDKVEYSSPLDYGIDSDKWDVSDGVSPSCLQWFCQQKNISHYAYDVFNNCFIKNVSTNRNYKALCYFAINEHMYLVTDKTLRENMMKRAADKKGVNVHSDMLGDDFEAKNIYSQFPIIENIDVKDITKYNETTIFMFSKVGKTNINDELYEIIKLYNIIPDPKNIISFNHNITKFSITIKNVLYYFCLDPSDLKEGCDYKLVKSLCDKMNIEFKNQSFTSFVIELNKTFIDKKNERVNFNDDERQQLLKQFNNKCNVCRDKIKDLFHIDHIRPLANGGNNDNDNLQVLCKQCHQDKTETEIENGAYNKLRDSQSSFNKKVTKIMNSQAAKAYAFIETLQQKQQYNKVFSLDINKCRTNILYYLKYNYPVFSVMDDVVKYTGQTGTGIYYVESENYIPLRGNGWYYYPVIEYCLNNGIIQPHQIKYTVQASFNVSGDYFNDFINFCRNNLGDYAKLAINSFIGCFNLNTNKNTFTKTLGIVKKSFDAYNYLFCNNDKTFINSFNIGDDVYYHMYEDIIKQNMETESPIYNQIVQMENILLHEMIIMIQNKGGRVLDVNTDCVYCEFPNDNLPFELVNNNINSYYWGDGVYKYKLESIDKRLTVERMKQYIRTDIYTSKPNEWKLFNDVQDNNFTSLVDIIIESNQSFNILGAAGCGKSTLIKMIQRELTNDDKNFITLCPTNKAALIIPDAMTIHKFKNKMGRMNYLKNNNIDYIFVDEISMMHEIFYKFLMLLKSLKPDIKFIMCGDFEQLKPVNDRYHGNYKNSSALFELCDGNRLNLNTCRRANNDLFTVCSDIKNKKDIDISPFKNNLEKINLCYTNKKRIEINKHFMKKMIMKKKSVGLYLPRLKHNDNSQDVNLFVGMPIISYKNSSKLDIVNNESFVITDINNDTIEFKNKRIENLEISINDFQRYFYVNYATTIHKAQGETIKKPYTIHEWSKLNRRLRYVALSRATELNNINIIY
jgi:energy-coupling factor transporter ATP-binding protein EcfA2